MTQHDSGQERAVDKRFRKYPADPKEFLSRNYTENPCPEFVCAKYNGERRYWVSPIGFRFYAFQSKRDGLWSILDRSWDLSITKGYRSRTKAIRAFNKLSREWFTVLGIKRA